MNVHHYRAQNMMRWRNFSGAYAYAVTREASQSLYDPERYVVN